MRQMLKDQEVGLDPHFRYRGKNQTRVEAFTDAAFALGITLIVLSSSVPHTFDELWGSLKDVLPFGLCVVLVMVIWYQHYIFFLRYGLQDLRTISYNTFLIFLILIYVYPLKFLFVILFDLYSGLLTGNDQIIRYTFSEVIAMGDTKYLMIIYGVGAMLIFGTFCLMYKHALKKRDELELDEYEVFETVTMLKVNMFLAVVPLISTLIAITGLFGNWNFLASGLTYMIYPPLMIITGARRERQRKALVKKLGLE
ncbi:TMEM175 family protein [Marinoscillum sp.]|uniref:TMEM175 family protein n=1 Tax=Marinoscillum sp. TaxID=2024838 RepID=UPI003BA8BF99